MHTRALAVIPARFASSRFPGKPLVADTGKPLIQHVVERVAQAKLVSRAVVATDDPRIFDAVCAFGGEAVMTGQHPNGTSRIAEAVELLASDHDLIVNVQGDEPEVPADTIDALIQGLADDPQAQMATLASPFDPDEDPHNPNVVKLVLNRQGRAIYFSRALIPHDRDPTPAPGSAEGSTNALRPTLYKHPGLYAYRRSFLSIYRDLEPTPLEQTEQLEQLRVLEHGYAIKIIHAPAPHPGIDTPEQYAAFVKRCS